MHETCFSFCWKERDRERKKNEGEKERKKNGREWEIKERRKKDGRQEGKRNRKRVTKYSYCFIYLIFLAFGGGNSTFIWVMKKGFCLLECL